MEVAGLVVGSVALLIAVVSFLTSVAIVVRLLPEERKPRVGPDDFRR